MQSSHLSVVVVLTLSVAACRPPSLTEGMPETVARALEVCEAREGEARDFCAYTTMEQLTARPGPSAADVGGAEIMAVCDRMESQDSKDSCIELAVRVDRPAAGESCGLIQSDRVRYSCWLEAADALMRRQDITFDAALDACEKAGPIVEHCLAHVAEAWLSRWRSAGLPSMIADVRTIVARFEGAEDMEHFGSSVGSTAAAMGVRPGQPGPCEALGAGAGAQICQHRMSANQNLGRDPAGPRSPATPR